MTRIALLALALCAGCTRHPAPAAAVIDPPRPAVERPPRHLHPAQKRLIDQIGRDLQRARDGTVPDPQTPPQGQ